MFAAETRHFHIICMTQRNKTGHIEKLCSQTKRGTFRKVVDSQTRIVTFGNFVQKPILSLSEMWSALILVCGLAVLTHGQTEDEKIRDFLEGPDGYNARAEAMFNKVSTANWAYYTNITDENQEKMVCLRFPSSMYLEPADRTQ